MHWIMVGTSHRDTPVAIREQLAFPPSELPGALDTLLASPVVREGLILSTCNRTEIYAVVVDNALGRQALEALLLRQTPSDAGIDARHIVVREGLEVVAHLLRVAAGLESQMVGESQIQGQLKAAHALARSQGSLGALLDGAFRHALVAGKRARTETAIARGGLSFARASIALARRVLGDLNGRSALILGTGKMGELAAKHLMAEGPAEVVVVNRTFESAEALAAGIGAGVKPFLQLAEVLAHVDMAVCCTGARHHVLTAADLAPIAAQRGDRPLVLIDLAVPRNLDPAIRDLPGIWVFDIDDVAAAGQSDEPNRSAMVAAVEVILADELAHFEAWLKNYLLGPTYRALREHADALRDGEIERLWQKHGAHFNPAQRALVAAMARSLANKFTHRPLAQLRGMSALEQPQHAAALRRLFDLTIAKNEAARAAADSSVAPTAPVAPGWQVQAVGLPMEPDPATAQRLVV